MDHPQPPQQPPQDDPAARFRKPQGASAPAQAAPPPPKQAMPPFLWFLVGAATASAGWYGYGLMQASMVKSAAQAMAVAGSSGDLNGQMQEFLSQAQRSSQQLTAAATAGGSSLDLISGPGSSGSGAPSSALAIDPQQAQAMNKAGADMIASLMPMISNPALTKNLPPDKKKQIDTITAALMSMQATMASGRPIDKTQADALMRTVQELQRQNPMPAPEGSRR